MTLGALHHHFGTKTGLFEAALDHAVKVFEAELYAPLLVTIGRGEHSQNVEQAARRSFRFTRERPAISRFLMRISDREMGTAEMDPAPLQHATLLRAADAPWPHFDW